MKGNALIFVNSHANHGLMKRRFFTMLAKLNKLVLPSLTARRLDLAKANKWQLALIAYRYWVTTNALD